jgi:hypothetical protein
MLSVRTEVDGLPLEARVPATRMAFSQYAQVVNRWHPGVSLAGDVIIGRFHSNSTLLVDASMHPRIEGHTSVAGRVTIQGRGNQSAIFSRGLVTRASPLPFPHRPVDMQALAESRAAVHHIDEDAGIRFLEDGSYRWQPLAGTASPACVVPGQNPWLIVGGEGVELQVEGVVRGSLLVYSPTRISIVGNLRYASDPRMLDSEDFLGLVSDGYVEVAGPDLTGDGDLELFAAIYAGRQFRVRKYRAPGGSMLSIYGSVTAGSLSASEPRFRTRLEFDPRLESRRPAWFPMTNRYVMDEAALYWTVAAHPTK